MDGHLSVRTYIGTVFTLVSIGLAACGAAPQSSSTEAPRTAEPILSTETVIPSNTPAATPTITATETVDPPTTGEPLFPTDDEIDLLLEAFEAPNPDTGTGHVPASSSQLINLEQICRNLMEQERLLNPDCSSNDERTTTYAIPEKGVLYQVVSMPAAEIGQQYYDDLLRTSSTWGNEGLLIGGLIVHQPDAMQDFPLPLGILGVFLTNNNNELTFDLIDQEGAIAVSGLWQLRMLDAIVAEPYTYVTTKMICFSQQYMQACLDLISNRGEDQKQLLIDQATNKLRAAGLLGDDAIVNGDYALASIDSLSTIENCQALLEEAQPQECLPDIVATGAESNPIQGGGQISQTLIGIGVAEVSAPIENYVHDLKNFATLEPDSYRIDLIQLNDGQWLAQYVRAGDLARFYNLAIPVPGRGQLLDPVTLEPKEEPGEPSQVLLDRYIWSPCQTSNTARSCSSAGRWHRDYCFTNWRGGWCDLIGY